MNIIAVINQKGGVGKTTTALALGAALQTRNRKTLLIDLDAQGNLSYAANAPAGHISVFDVMSGIANFSDAVFHTESYDILPASPQLAGADVSFNSTGKEYKLKEALSQVLSQYDFIILDTPPSLGIMTVNALTAATDIIIPAQADIFSLQGIGQLYQTLDAVKKYTNPSLKILGILLTRYNQRSILSRDITEMIQETANELETKVFNSKIREAIAVKEAQASKTDLFSYAAKSGAASDYEAFVTELSELIMEGAI